MLFLGAIILLAVFGGLRAPSLRTWVKVVIVALPLILVGFIPGVAKTGIGQALAGGTIIGALMARSKIARPPKKKKPRGRQGGNQRQQDDEDDEDD